MLHFVSIIMKHGRLNIQAMHREVKEKRYRCYASLIKKVVVASKTANLFFLQVVKHNSWSMDEIQKILEEAQNVMKTVVILMQSSTNWANKPTGSWSLCWIQINLPNSE